MHLPSRVHHDDVDGLEHAVALHRDGAVAAVRVKLSGHHQPHVQHHQSAVMQLPCIVQESMPQ